MGTHTTYHGYCQRHQRTDILPGGRPLRLSIVETKGATGSVNSTAHPRQMDKRAPLAIMILHRPTGSHGGIPARFVRVASNQFRGGFYYANHVWKTHR